APAPPRPPPAPARLARRRPAAGVWPPLRPAPAAALSARPRFARLRVRAATTRSARAARVPARARRDCASPARDRHASLPTDRPRRACRAGAACAPAPPPTRWCCQATHRGCAAARRPRCRPTRAARPAPAGALRAPPRSPGPGRATRATATAPPPLRDRPAAAARPLPPQFPSRSPRALLPAPARARDAVPGASRQFPCELLPRQLPEGAERLDGECPVPAFDVFEQRAQRADQRQAQLAIQDQLDFDALGETLHALVVGLQLHQRPARGHPMDAELDASIRMLEKPVDDPVFDARRNQQHQAHEGGKSSHGRTSASRGRDGGAPNLRNIAGSSSRVSAVDETSPPITTIASGRWISEPGPVANNSGTSPPAVIAAVIITGRSRRFAPSTAACAIDMPCASNWLKWLTSTTPLSTAMPSSAMKPTDAGTDTYSPAIARPNTPPTSASGMFESTRSVWRNEPKVEKSRNAINASATGITIDRRRAARCWFSNCPPQARAEARGVGRGCRCGR